MAVTKTGNGEKRAKRTEKMVAAERLTNGFMLNLTYGLGAIILLEIVRRQYMLYMSRFSESYLTFASKFCIVFGVLFAVGAGITALLGGIRKISAARSRNYTIFFAVSSIVSFLLSYDVRLPISNWLRGMGVSGGVLNFLVNLDLGGHDVVWVEYGVIAFIVIAFIVYAVRLALLEKKK